MMLSSGIHDKKVLILSDGKPGHVNQSLALARHLGLDYELCRVGFKNRIYKGFSYLFDHLGWYTSSLFSSESVASDYCGIISAGSDTYYANKVLSRRQKCRSVAVMLPRGYRYDFDLILAQKHDRPPMRENIQLLPVNLSFPEPAGIVNVEEGKRYVSLVIGGNSKLFKIERGLLQRQVEQVFSLFPDSDLLVTTSRRTPMEIEDMLKSFPFAQSIYFSSGEGNPIPDFLQISDYVFITEDSSSMISEAVSFGRACIEILPLSGGCSANKSSRLIEDLEKQNCLHLFDGKLGKSHSKIHLAEYLDGINLPCESTREDCAV